MKTLIICVSIHPGNTEKIAEAQFVTTCTAYNKAHLERVAGAQAADKIHLSDRDIV